MGGCKYVSLNASDKDMNGYQNIKGEKIMSIVNEGYKKQTNMETHEASHSPDIHIKLLFYL